MTGAAARAATRSGTRPSGRRTPPGSGARCYFGAETVNSRLYLFGGQNLDYKALNEADASIIIREVGAETALFASPPLAELRQSAAEAHRRKVVAAGLLKGEAGGEE